MLRLSLNIASTRLILTHGHEGTEAAGHVIEVFGEFVAGGNAVIGIIVFILTVVNFVVITKGAGRIAEVAARFTLDAMPGKQMAIDADLNAGLIDEKTPSAAARNSSTKAASTAPWTAPRSSSAAMPSRASSSPSSTSSAASSSAWRSRA